MGCNSQSDTNTKIRYIAIQQRLDRTSNGWLYLRRDQVWSAWAKKFQRQWTGLQAERRHGEEQRLANSHPTTPSNNAFCCVTWERECPMCQSDQSSPVRTAREAAREVKETGGTEKGKWSRESDGQMTDRSPDFQWKKPIKRIFTNCNGRGANQMWPRETSKINACHNAQNAELRGITHWSLQKWHRASKKSCKWMNGSLGSNNWEKKRIIHESRITHESPSMRQ